MELEMLWANACELMQQEISLLSYNSITHSAAFVNLSLFVFLLLLLFQKAFPLHFLLHNMY